MNDDRPSGVIVRDESRELERRIDYWRNRALCAEARIVMLRAEIRVKEEVKTA